MYKVLGVMSGSSLDGLDLCISSFSQENGLWSSEILKTAAVVFPENLVAKLANPRNLTGLELTILENKFSGFVADSINTHFSNDDYELIGFHGHTIFHNPNEGYTLQIGNGALLSAKCNKPVVYDFRRTDVALNGQGAPLVPVGDTLLFNQYAGCLNLGGIANLSVIPKEGDILKLAGFDVCACNQVLNYYAQQLGFQYDESGKLARLGTVDANLLAFYNNIPWLALPYPKSLGNEYVYEHYIEQAPKVHSADGLATATAHIAEQIAKAISAYNLKGEVLVTGGGAFNTFLMEEISKMLIQLNSAASIMVASPELINFKEAHLFAFLGLLRCLEIENTWASVTGATHNAISGALVGINPYK
jgi:anhydro-N-acetylmuramic acid kinase